MSTLAHPSPLRLALHEAGTRTVAFRRSPIAAFFTIAFPLILLNLVGMLVGNGVLESRSGIRVTQFLTPAIGAYAAATAAYTSLAIGLSIDREKGVLRRHRGLPIPTGALLGGRALSGVITGMAALLLMVLFGVARFGVQIVWAKVPAALVTSILGILCFAALGFAVSSLARTPAATQAITNATLVPLGFISDVFVVGDDMPEVLSRIGGLFPLRPFANAMGETFNPFTPGAGFAWSHLAMLLGWGVAGFLVARRRFTWQVQQPVRRAAAEGAAAVAEVNRQRPRTLSPVAEMGRPAALGQILANTRDGVIAILRTPSSAFFTIAFPVVMLLLFTAVFGNPTLDDRGGVPLAQHLAPAMAIFGMATVTYAELAERLASQRDRGILKRVRGTPLPLWQFLAGRIGAAVVIALATTVLTVAVGVVGYGVEVPLARVPLAIVVLALGVGTFTLLGLALVALAPNAESVSPIANGTLLPAAFISDVFLIGTLPAGLSAIGDVLPLRPAVTALSDALNPGLSGAVPWDRLAVVLAWGVAAAVVAARRFSWEPR